MCDVYSQLCCFGAMSVDLVNNIVVGAQSFLSSLYKSCFVQRLRHPICHPNSNRTRWEEWHKKKAHDIVIIQLIESNNQVENGMRYETCILARLTCIQTTKCQKNCKLFRFRWQTNWNFLFNKCLGNGYGFVIVSFKQCLYCSSHLSVKFVVLYIWFNISSFLCY